MEKTRKIKMDDNITFIWLTLPQYYLYNYIKIVAIALDVLRHFVITDKKKQKKSDS